MIKAGDSCTGPQERQRKNVPEIGWRGVLVSCIHYKKGGGVRRWLSILMMECFLVGIFAERVVVGETEQRKQQKELKRR